MKNVLITGGTRGIGAALSEVLSNEGFQVAAVYKSDQEAANKLIKRTTGGHLKVYQADVSDYSSVQKLAADFMNDFGMINILINNAGIADFKTYDTIQYQDWLNIIQANLTSTFIVTQAFLENMIEGKSGRIINMSSIAAFTGGMVGPHYAASKAGQIGLTHYYAKALAPHKITVNAIAPALIITDMIKNPKSINPNFIPMNRLGNVEDVVSAVKFLIESDFVTGQTIHVDGGLLFS